jgi:hypothetical protein
MDEAIRTKLPALDRFGHPERLGAGAKAQLKNSMHSSARRSDPLRSRIVGIEADTREKYRVVGDFDVNLRERMAAIDASLDDLQSGMEASSRAADGLRIETTKFNGLLKAPLIRSVVRRVKDLRACARDQRAALRELRNSFARLREELRIAQRAAFRPPPTASPDDARRR